ncbi:4Fe-4S dicluster domain-containing protein [uncultured Megasphaera sp.]|nr:4Fe-4S dicluster domain-containing protein [uncultured Megasphaera sp.]
MALLRQMTDGAVAKIRRTDGRVEAVVVDGDAKAPYYIPKGLDGQPAKFLKAKPKTDKEKCISCGLCARQCPMGSIDAEDTSQVTGICIKCQRCVRNCPKGAKYFDDPAFLSHVKMLERDYTGRAENKIFL